MTMENLLNAKSVPELLRFVRYFEFHNAKAARKTAEYSVANAILKAEKAGSTLEEIKIAFASDFNTLDFTNAMLYPRRLKND